MQDKWSLGYFILLGMKTSGCGHEDTGLKTPPGVRNAPDSGSGWSDLDTPA